MWNRRQVSAHMMIDQISIQSRIVCTSTANHLTFVFASTLTHLKHPPSVWPCIANVNTAPWLLIDKACLISSFAANPFYTSVSFHAAPPASCFSRTAASFLHWLSILGTTGLSSKSDTRSGLEKFFKMIWQNLEGLCRVLPSQRYLTDFHGGSLMCSTSYVTISLTWDNLILLL